MEGSPDENQTCPLLPLGRIGPWRSQVLKRAIKARRGYLQSARHRGPGFWWDFGLAPRCRGGALELLRQRGMAPNWTGVQAANCPLRLGAAIRDTSAESHCSCIGVWAHKGPGTLTWCMRAEHKGTRSTNCCQLGVVEALWARQR
ncbi:hypothetical protein NDU88_007537 [Pleurodeles waltl]|uniref:Uncharacterized protein n=1 Tax=Pleurodeles waltl TaxID=8319 RepID=A0AAV7PLZ7_PLEWA|nr:hypothetical protein NDU88_007537 [Pleurodeles waltl]